MPSWLQEVLWASGGVLALGTLWNKVVKPLARLVLVVPVVLEIAEQFKTDSGSSLRDTVNRLEAAAKENARLAGELAARVEKVRILAVDDRDKATHRTDLLEDMRDTKE